jgi:hypothetical protein
MPQPVAANIVSSPNMPYQPYDATDQPGTRAHPFAQLPSGPLDLGTGQFSADHWAGIDDSGDTRDGLAQAQSHHFKQT